MTVKAIFLDKDGTLIENVPYNTDPSRVRLTPGAGPALVRLHTLGYALIVVSNQPGIAHGFFAPRALDAVYERLRILLAPYHVPLAGFYYCPHHPAGRVPRYATACGCRKPAPGLLLAAATIHGVHLERSWMIGDILDDVEAGQRAGCRTVLVDNGNETEWRQGPFRAPDATATDLRGAAERIARCAAWSERYYRREVRA
ncbi:HAD family hydrolase [Sulfurifustis variabilis]|uniref:D,D-heptose 1,7-bisphosphate phosphatase n=1 Tax=Sulfurifustis variabilis TaxID=1675686 RepID=A0A1B4V413_9GAMM|nr:HAD family hydrolase [Sulfurifustis variabilis]BAU48283.1 HAD family hydrolase [Sulfurifustis variabilis]